AECAEREIERAGRAIENNETDARQSVNPSKPDSGRHKRKEVHAKFTLGQFHARRRIHSGVIPGRAQHEPGIHNHYREYGFRASRLCRSPGMTETRVRVAPSIQRKLLLDLEHRFPTRIGADDAALDLFPLAAGDRYDACGVIGVMDLRIGAAPVPWL